MSQLVLSKKKAIRLSNGIFLVAIALLAFTGYWWPGMILAVGITISVRQYLQGRIYPSAITTVITALLFITVFFQLEWGSYIPALLLIAGIFIIVREVYFSRDTNGEDKAEEIKEDADL